MSDCLFCKIIAGEIPCYKVYEDPNTLVFLDIFPSQEGHCLVIPKKHADNIWDLDEEDAGEILKVARKVANAIKNALNCDGLSIVQSNNKIAGQEIMHYHMHLVPRYKGRGAEGAMNAFKPEGYVYAPTKEELSETRDRIVKGIEHRA